MRTAGMILLTIVAAAAAGCGGGPVGADLSVRPKPSSLARVATLELPADEPFSIALFSANKQRGLAGDAQADASASPDGAARATAQVTEGGSATADFRVGHSFANDSGGQLDLDFEVDLAYAFECTAKPVSDAADASVDLGLFVRGARNRLLSSYELLDHSTDQGDAAGSNRDALRFRVTLAPHERVDVFVSGTLKLENDAGRSAEASLGVKDLVMRVRSSAGRAAGAGGGG